MKCLQKDCDNEIQSKTGRRKFCSDKCKMKHFRKVGKKDAVTKLDVISAFNEFRAAIQNFAGMVNHGQVPTILDAPKQKQPIIHDEPLSFDKMKSDLIENSYEYFWHQMQKAKDLEELEAIGRKIKTSGLGWKQQQMLNEEGRRLGREM